MSLYDFPAKHTTPQVLEAIYRDGFPGCHLDPAAVEDVVSQEIVQTFSQACPHLRGLHATRDHAYHFLSLIQLEARAGFARVLYEDERQPYGNCVSRGSQHARATTNAVEIHVAGEAEQYVRPAWESTYRGRGHRGHGMNPATAARIDVDRGFLWRRKYDFADLTTQNADFGRGTGYSTAVAAEMDLHHVGKWILPETTEEALDLFAAGYSCHSGQNLGFSSRPNARGIHPPSGRWNHDMASCGYDLSQQIWQDDVVFVPNSWGAWNTPSPLWPTDRWGPWPGGLIICELDVWAKWFVGSGSIFFYADVDGVPAKNLPDWGSAGYL